MSLCSVHNCNKKSFCRGFCSKHYQRWQKYGDPDFVKRVQSDFGASREFIEGVQNIITDDCIICPFNISKGYCRVNINNVRWLGHRYSLYLFTGKSPKDKFACHKCNNPLCVNPRHLYWGTHDENMLDVVKSGSQKGSNNGFSKLSDQDVIDIRKDNRSQRQIAKDYNLTQSNISCIKRGKTWRHLLNNE